MPNFTMYDREREFKWQIECQLSGGTYAYIDAEDIYSGRLTRQISSGEGIEVGSCYVSELDLTIVASALPSNVVSVKPYFRLLTSTEIVEGVVRKYYTPYNLGVFKIASTKRKEYGRIDLVCYDKMADLDKLITPANYTELLASDWKPFYLLDWIATKVGVTYTFTQAGIEAMPNGTLYFKLAEETSNIKTYRDLLQYVCMLIGAYGIFDEDGHLNVKTFADTTSYSLPASFRFSESFGDVPISYSGVELTVKNATTMFGNANNTVVTLLDNPFLYTLSNLNQTTDYATFIMQFLRNIYIEFQGLSYYAGEFEIPPDASLNVGRLLAVTGGGASNTINCFLQKIDVNFDGRMMLSCGNPNTYVTRTQNRTTSSITNLTNRIETLESSQGGKEVYCGTSEPSDSLGENGNVYYEVIEKADDVKTLEILDSIYITSGAFNIAYTHKLTTSVILNVTATSGSNFLIGSGGSVANARFTVRLQGGSTARFEIGSKYASKDNVGFTSGDVSASIPEQTMTLASESLYIQDISTASEGLAPLLLNSFNQSTSGDIYPSESYSDGHTYYHEIKIYEGGTLVRDFIPVINVDDATDYGFFDTVNRVYYDLATYGYSNRNVQGGASCVAGNRTGKYVVTSYSSVEKEYVKIKGEWIEYTADSGDTVEVAQSLASGTEIATISVNGADTKLYAPTATNVTVTPITTTGTNIANIAVDGTTYNLFAPSGGGGEATETALIYSNEERVVGVWTDNRPLYQKTYTYSFTASSNDHNYDIATLSSEVKPQYIETDVFYRDGILFKEVIYPPGNIFYRYIIDGNVLSVRVFNSSGSTIEGTVTVRYTKTTDTPGSAPYVTSGSYAHHYSTTEQVVGTWIDGSTLYERTYDLDSDLTLQDSTWTDTGIAIPTNANRCIKAEGIQSDGTSTCIMASIASANITVQSTKNGGDSIRYLTIQYTKTS